MNEGTSLVPVDQIERAILLMRGQIGGTVVGLDVLTSGRDGSRASSGPTTRRLPSGCPG